MNKPRNETSAGEWRFSRHLERRVAERGISIPAVLATLEEPEITYTQSTYGPSRQVRQRGEIGLVVDTCTHTVITVVFRRPEDWARQLDAAAVPA